MLSTIGTILVLTSVATGIVVAGWGLARFFRDRSRSDFDETWMSPIYPRVQLGGLLVLAIFLLGQWLRNRG